ncbi:MAG: AarF/ABC1/UbiB kinase family protein [Pseudomonadota bacterium]
MTDSPKDSRTKPESRPESRAVPRGRISRLGRFGQLAGGIAGGVVAEGARRVARGERPKMRDMLLTPGNVNRVADQLSQLRGAAMKLGQMISMDAGDMLPEELSALLARLRDKAYHMPPKQLQQTLNEQWGEGWRRRFKRFTAHPAAAASIGQVHRATTPDGRELAIKVQYPGITDSIDSDVDNVATLLRVSGMLPKELDIQPLLEEAKRQLHEETDYLREGNEMREFGALLADDPRFVVPVLDEEFTTDRVLAMSWEEGHAIEKLADADQEQRNQVMTALMDLVLREMYVFGRMQTDPNFANYRYRPETNQLVLLDFGAAREVDAQAVTNYRALLKAGMEQDHEAVLQGALNAGFMSPLAVERHRDIIDRMVSVIVEEANRPGLFDFGDRAFVGVLAEQGRSMAEDRAIWHIPPVEALFLQRKISGTALLAARLKAKVDIRSMVERYLVEEDVP